MNGRKYSGNKGGRAGGYRGGGRNQIDRITASYNFVPLFENVYFPNWYKTVCHDVPLEDGYCGSLNLTIKSHTHILPGQKRGEWVEHFTLPGGHLAIPGSTLRGMIRNVVEIVSFGKMRLMDDTLFGIRDLTAGARNIYGNKMTLPPKSPQGPFKTRVKTGWLDYNAQTKSWEVTPCACSRIDKKDLAGLSTTSQWIDLIHGKIDRHGKIQNKKTYPTAIDKYEWWQVRESLSVQFDPGSPKDHGPGIHGKVRGKQKYLHYSRAENLGRGKQTGHLVFTGQPGPNKHLEFVFHDDASAVTPIAVEREVFHGFRQIYLSDTNSSTYEVFNYLREKKFLGKGIPIFYLSDGENEISSIGLSMMYRLPYSNSVGKFICTHGSDHDNDVRPDLAELIFGTVDENNGEKSLKGRVSFSHAFANQKKKNSNTKDCPTILNGPKPTYYPNYIEQKHTDGKLNGHAYSTYMEDDARIRGWKRYPVRPADKVEPVQPEKGHTEKVKTYLRPVTDKVTYQGKLRFHNLKKEELGALLWSITWGGDPDLRHALGMGKPFGFGQLSIEVDWDSSTVIPNKPSLQVPPQDEFENAFKQNMEEFVSPWEQSNQIIQLKAMADPRQAPGLPGKLEHLSLNGGGRNNEFTLAKGAQRNDKLVLQPYVDIGSTDKVVTGVQTKTDTKAEKWLHQTVDKIIAKHHSDQKTSLLGRFVAMEWGKIEDSSLKDEVLKIIKAFWEQNGGWEGPHKGKSKTTAYSIYTKNN